MHYASIELPEGQTPAPAGARRNEGTLSPESVARAYLPLVRKIAWDLRRRSSRAIEVEDLVQIGILSLLEAARRYEDRGRGFASYAAKRARGAMIDALRKASHLPRSALDMRRHIASARTSHVQEAGTAPTDEEMAEKLDLQVDDYRRLAWKAAAPGEQSLEEIYTDADSRFSVSEPLADDLLSRRQMHRSLAGAIRRLPEREATILQLYFIEEMSLGAIGESMGLGAARICQIKKSALERLKSDLAAWR